MIDAVVGWLVILAGWAIAEGLGRVPLGRIPLNRPWQRRTVGERAEPQETAVVE